MGPEAVHRIGAKRLFCWGQLGQRYQSVDQLPEPFWHCSQLKKKEKKLAHVKCTCVRAISQTFCRMCRVVFGCATEITGVSGSSSPPSLHCTACRGGWFFLLSFFVQIITFSMRRVSNEKQMKNGVIAYCDLLR